MMSRVRLDFENKVISLEISAGKIKNRKKSYIIVLSKVKQLGIEEVVIFVLVQQGSQIGVEEGCCLLHD